MLQYDQQKHGNEIRLYAPVFKIQIRKTYTLRAIVALCQTATLDSFYKATVDKKNP
jgi:hypothetical protein